MTTRKESKTKGVFFNKPEVIKEKVIGDELEITFRTMVEIPVTAYVKIPAKDNEKLRKVMQGVIDMGIDESIEKGIELMTKCIAPLSTKEIVLNKLNEILEKVKEDK